MGVGYLSLEGRAAPPGMSQTELARRAIRTSQPRTDQWESGSQVPSVRSMMKKIADIR